MLVVTAGEEYTGPSKTIPGVSSQVTLPEYTLPINTLKSVPSYEDDPVGFELYKTREKQKTTASTCVPSHVFWVKLYGGPDCIPTSKIEEVGT